LPEVLSRFPLRDKTSFFSSTDSRLKSADPEISDYVSEFWLTHCVSAARNTRE